MSHERCTVWIEGDGTTSWGRFEQVLRKVRVLVETAEDDEAVVRWAIVAAVKQVWGARASVFGLTTMKGSRFGGELDPARTSAQVKRTYSAGVGPHTQSREYVYGVMQFEVRAGWQ